MIPVKAQFEGCEGIFQIRFTRCLDPECQCGEVTAHLQQQTEDGQYLQEGVRLDIRLDPIAWREVDPPERSPSQSGLVEEFLRDYPEKGRAQLRQATLQKQKEAARLGQCSLTRAQLSGQLVSLCELASDGARDSVGLLTSFRQVYWDGCVYYVDDLYCGNPACDCRKATLAFYTVQVEDDGVAALKPLFLAEVPLDRSAPTEIVSVTGCTRNMAKVLLDTWEQRRLEETPRLRLRYSTLKKIAARSGDKARVQAPGAEPARNESCPCGSGRKYKNCCGRR